MPKLTKTQKALRHAVATTYPQIGVKDYYERLQSWGDFLTVHECQFDRETLLLWMSLNTPPKNLILTQLYVPVRSRQMRKQGSMPRPRTPDEWMYEPDVGPDYLPKRSDHTFDKNYKLPSKKVGAYVQTYDMSVHEDVDWDIQQRWVLQVVFRGDPGQKPRTKLLMKNDGIFPVSWSKLYLGNDFIARAYRNAESKYGVGGNTTKQIPLLNLATQITSSKYLQPVK